MSTTTDTDPVVYPKHPFIQDDGDGACAYCGGSVVEDDDRHEEPFERSLEECLDDLKEQAVAEHPFVANPDDPESCLSCNQGRSFGAHPAPDAADPTPEPFVRPAPLTLAEALQRVSEREKAAKEATAALTIAKANAKGADELYQSALQTLREAAQREVEMELPFDDAA